MIPMTVSLVLEFCYLLQMAENKLLYRTVTTFGSFILSFVIIYLSQGIDLFSYAVFMALSITLGSVVFVLFYIRQYSISPLSILGNIVRVGGPMLLLMAVSYYILQNIVDSTCQERILFFFIEVLVFNALLCLVTLFLSLSKEDRKRIYVKRK